MKSTIKDYEKYYTEIRSIGKGTYGSAYLVKNSQDKSLYVAKKIPLISLSLKELEAAVHEATLLKNLSNPHVVSYKNSYYDKSLLIIVMEYCESISTLNLRGRSRNAY